MPTCLNPTYKVRDFFGLAKVLTEKLSDSIFGGEGMKKVLHNRLLGRGLGVAAIALFSYCPPGLAQSDRSASPENRSFQQAQATRNLCRIVRASDGLVVRSRPDPTAPAEGRLELSDRVTLIQDYRGIRGPDKRIWVEINSPVRGFISNGYPGTPSNLKNCEESTPSQNPTPNPNLCRQANPSVAPQGLVVRADASSSSRA